VRRRYTFLFAAARGACIRAGASMFISNAFAQSAGAVSEGGSMMSIVFMIAIFVVFYFLLIRPQAKRQKEQKAMIQSLNKGDEVVTVGGMVGKITELSDQYLTLQIAMINDKAVEVSVQRAAVQMPLPKGTMKAL
jgi:preprotein translocase subunit YajC